MPISTARNNGFTLLEIMIVIALVALVTALMVPSFSGVFRTSNESFTRQISLLLRDARDRALLKDKLIRLRVDFEKQEFWLEEAPSSYLVPKASSLPTDLRGREDAEKKEDGSFVMVAELTKEKRKLPPGLKIIEIISPRSKNPIKEGTADVFFFPNGNADGVVMHFETEDKLQQSLIVHPITGQSKVKPGFVTQEDK